MTCGQCQVPEWTIHLQSINVLSNRNFKKRKRKKKKKKGGKSGIRRLNQRTKLNFCNRRAVQ